MRTGAPRRAWLEPLLITVGVLVLRLPTLWSNRWFDPDEAAIAVQAQALQRGGTLYVDMIDRKPPIPPLLYELSFCLTGSPDLRPIRLLVGLMLAVATIVVVREVRHTHGERAARWAGVLYVLGAMAFTPVDAGAANYAHFALPVATVALVLSRRSSLRWAACAGVLLGLAILSRQSWIFAVPAGALSVLRVNRVRGAAVFGTGCAVGVLACAVVVPFSDFWYWTFASTPGFVFASIGVGVVVTQGGKALALFVARHLALVGAAGRASRESWRADIDLWAWVATALVAITAGFRFYGHYWMQILPPLVLLAAPVMARLSARWRAAGAASLAVVGVLSWVLLLTPNVFRDRPDAAPVASYVRAHTSPDQRLFVWGTFPELLVEADRPVAGRLVHSDFVTGRSGGRDDPAETLPLASARALQTMMDDLRADPPAIIVDTSGVARLAYGHYPISVVPELQRFVSDHYVVDTVIGEFTVYRLR